MRKAISLLIALVLCLSIVAPVFAAEGEFVPSITYKPNPEVIPVEDENGEEYIGVIRNQDGEIIDYVEHGCILITPVAHLWDEEKVVPDDVERLLTFVYEGLESDEMQIPYEKHDAGLNPDNMVIRDLFDARWVCEEHRKMVEEEGIVLELTFDLGVVAEAQIYVQTYDEEADEWSPIKKAENNGDGTVSCTFEHLCAIAFSMPVAAGTVPSEEEPAANLLLWIILLILAIVAAVAVAIVKTKKKTAV